MMFDENGNSAAAMMAVLNNATTASTTPSGAINGQHMILNQLFNTKDSRWLQLEVCREFQRGQCTRTDLECRFAHPPPHVEIQNGRVTACYDSIKGRCTRENPKCKYLHPPQHLKDQLLINGKQNLAMRSLLCSQLNQTTNSNALPVNALPSIAQIQQQPATQVLQQALPMSFIPSTFSATLNPALYSSPLLQSSLVDHFQSPSLAQQLALLHAQQQLTATANQQHQQLLQLALLQHQQQQQAIQQQVQALAATGGLPSIGQNSSGLPLATTPNLVQKGTGVTSHNHTATDAKSFSRKRKAKDAGLDSSTGESSVSSHGATSSTGSGLQGAETLNTADATQLLLANYAINNKKPAMDLSNLTPLYAPTQGAGQFNPFLMQQIPAALLPSYTLSVPPRY